MRKNHKIQRLICYEHLISLVHTTAGKNEVKNNFYYRNYKDSNLQLIVYTPPRLKRASLSLSFFFNAVIKQSQFSEFSELIFLSRG